MKQKLGSWVVKNKNRKEREDVEAIICILSALPSLRMAVGVKSPSRHGQFAVTSYGHMSIGTELHTT